MPKWKPSDATGDIGETTVELLFKKELGWSYHPFGNKRAGIDGEVEIVENGQYTGRLLAVQVRSGGSYLSRRTLEGIIYNGEQDELDYWSRYALPVVLVLYDPANDLAYWSSITKDTVENTGKGWKTVVPYVRTLTAASRGPLAALADGPPSTQRLRQLSMQKGLMTFLAEGGSISVTGTVWTNKATPRASMYLHFSDVNGRKGDHFEWGVSWPGGWPREFLEVRFPWAKVTVTVKGHDNEESLYQALRDDHGWAGPSFSWEDLLGEENIEGWEFKAELALGELGRSFLQVDAFVDGF
jgi:hypothetical protein